MEQFFQTQRDGCRNAIPKVMQRFHQSIGLNVEIALIEFIAITTGRKKRIGDYFTGGHRRRYRCRRADNHF